MRKSGVDKVITGLKAAGVSVVCYLPDSLLKELYPALDRDPDIRTIRVTNEGEGAAICGGIWLSGKRAALVMENSDRAPGPHGPRRRHPGHHADELPRRPRREQLVGRAPRHDHGAAAQRHAHSLSGGRSGGEHRPGDPGCVQLVLRRLLSLRDRTVRERGAMKRFDCMTALAAKLKEELVVLSLGVSVDEWYNAAPHMRAASLF